MYFRRTVVAFAVSIGAVLGITGTASAVPLSTWDRLAMCESSGRWHINTGNGYYGGLQFSHSTWKAYGGRTYNAHQATKRHQIQVAERVQNGGWNGYAPQGWGAWPTCSARQGLR